MKMTTFREGDLVRVYAGCAKYKGTVARIADTGLLVINWYEDENILQRLTGFFPSPKQCRRLIPKNRRMLWPKKMADKPAPEVKRDGDHYSKEIYGSSKFPFGNMTESTVMPHSHDSRFGIKVHCPVPECAWGKSLEFVKKCDCNICNTPTPPVGDATPKQGRRFWIAPYPYGPYQEPHTHQEAMSVKVDGWIEVQEILKPEETR